MTNSINEIPHNDVLFIIGSNATVAHPIIGNKMKQAAERGAKLIVVDPRRTELAEKAVLHLPIRPGTDNALVNGLLHHIISNDLHAKAYIEERCEGFEDLWAVVREYPPERAAEITGVPAADIRAAAELYATTPRAGIFYTLGITEHIVGTANVMNLANLAMATGHVGVEFAGVNPIRGQNNVQGACDMGALPNSFPGYPSVLDAAAKARFGAAWGTPMPDAIGLKVPEMFEAAVEGSLKAMFIMGEDPALTDADANHVRHALDSLEFLVVQDIRLTESAQYADVFLPAALYAEKEGTFTNTERRVQRVRKAVEPPGEARPDWEIILEISRRIGYPMPFSSPAEVFGEIRQVIPAFGGISHERIDREGGLQWPCPTEDHPGTQYLHKGGFTRGKGLMQGIEWAPPNEVVDAEYPLLLSTGRMLFQYNITTRISDSLTSLQPHELAQVHPEDAARIGVADGELVRVSSRRGSITTRIRLTDSVLPGMIYMTFHFKESPVNELTNPAADPVTKTAEYKVAAVRMEKLEAGAATG